MCFDVFHRKVSIEVKGPKENEVRIFKLSTPGSYAENPLVFWGGDNKYMRASFFDSAPLMSFVIIATIHDGGGQLLKTFDLPNSFLPYKGFVFDLKGPYDFEKIPIRGWWDDFSRFLKFRIGRKIKSQQPDNLPAVSPPLDDVRDKVNRWMDNGSCSSETNESHLVLTADTDQLTSLSKSLSQRTDESCDTGYSSYHTVYYDADTSSPLISLNSPNSSDVSIDKNAINTVPGTVPNIWDTYKGLKGTMDILAG